MRAVIQRVSRASVRVDGEIVGSIERGLLVLLGVASGDTTADGDYLVEKILNLRIFPDSAGKMNLSLVDIRGELLIVSQFTLLGSVVKGRRPSFDKAAPPEKANELYEYVVKQARKWVGKVETGTFRASMDVELLNQGPVTILCDSEKLF